jgi:hypothetical protein
MHTIRHHTKSNILHCKISKLLGGGRPVASGILWFCVKDNIYIYNDKVVVVPEPIMILILYHSLLCGFIDIGPHGVLWKVLLQWDL